MTFRIASRSIGGRPLIRVFAIAVSILVIFTVFQSVYLHEAADEDEFSSARSFRSTFSRITPLKYSSYRYEAPQDLVVPWWQSREIETESLIGKVTILFHGKDPTYIRAIQTHQAHSKLHGYPLLALRHAILDGIWSKPAYILAVILEELRKPDGQRLKWLLWVDADTVVTNPKIPLEIFLPPEEFPHLHLLITADPHGVNNGIFFIKVDPWSVELLSAVIAFPKFRPEVDLQYRDQSALEAILKDKFFKKNYAIVPQRWFNAYQAEPDGSRKHPFQVAPGDLLVHFPGVPQRDEAMRYYLDIAERHWAKWELDLGSTTYPEEIQNFWIEQQGSLAKERKQAQTLVSEARAFFTKFKEEFKQCRDRLDIGVVERAEQNVRTMNDALEDRRDDLDFVTDALHNLKKSAGYVRELIDESKQALHDEATNAISRNEEVLSQQVQDSKISNEKENQVVVQREALQGLLVEAADDQEATRQAIDDLRKLTAEIESGPDM